MRQLAYIIGIICLIAFASCKSNEANYRAAYERTIAGRQDGDSLIYSQIRREFTPGTMTYEGKTVPTGRQFVAITENGGGIAEYIKRYCVVAGQFKQIFNARSLRERLVEHGYPGAFIVHTREPYYFVVAGSFNEPQPAVEMYEKLKDDSELKLREPVPFILLPSQIR